MKHLDLFSGIGGFALASKWAGIETIAFCEINSFCQKVLAKNFPGVTIHSDIKKIDGAAFSDVDIITAGFPCQPFSVAGKQKGKDDDRYLWPELARIIRGSKPRWLLLENVPGIIPHLDPILEDLEAEGYTWWAYLIAASAVGAPHKRERLWIIANRNSERCDLRSDTWEERHIQDNLNRYIQALQSEWPQFKPLAWQTMQATDWMRFNAESSRNDDGVSFEFHIIRGLNEESSGSKSQSEISKLIWKILRVMWQNREIATSSPELYTNRIYNCVPEMPREYSHERWNMEYWFKKIEGLCDLWENFYTFPFKKAQNLQCELLKRIRQIECKQKMASRDRVKSLGNAIVPHIAYVFMRMIKLYDSK